MSHPQTTPTTLPTYIEQQYGHDFGFNWHEALDEPESYGLANLEKLAGDWVTCACGHQCAIIPRDDDDKPADFQLWLLGCQFAESIDSQDWREAKNILRKIERRSATIIRGILKP